MVANEVNDRMGRAVEELHDKYESGGKGYDAASDAQVMTSKHENLGFQKKRLGLRCGLWCMDDIIQVKNC